MMDADRLMPTEDEVARFVVESGWTRKRARRKLIAERYRAKQWADATPEEASRMKAETAGRRRGRRCCEDCRGPAPYLWGPGKRLADGPGYRCKVCHHDPDDPFFHQSETAQLHPVPA